MQIRWTFFLLLTWNLAQAALVAEASTGQQSTESSSTSVAENDTQGGESQRKIVKLTIDYGDGFQKCFTSLPWRRGMTVFDVMSQAMRHKRGRVEFKHRGKASTALLYQIDDLANQGGGRRNWIYYVNRQKADRSLAISKLDPGDEVLWRFEKYQ